MLFGLHKGIANTVALPVSRLPGGALHSRRLRRKPTQHPKRLPTIYSNFATANALTTGFFSGIFAFGGEPHEFSGEIAGIEKKQGLHAGSIRQGAERFPAAVAKWESGLAYPDITNLIHISDLMHVSFDSLVRDQDCGAAPVQMPPSLPDKIVAFRLKASRNTYAASRNATASTRFDSHDFHYEEGRTPIMTRISAGSSLPARRPSGKTDARSMQ